MDTAFLNSIAAFFVCAGIIVALVIANILTREKQPMKIMNAVWVLTGLWANVFAVGAFFKLGVRKDKMACMAMEKGMDMDMNAARPGWQSVALSALHCGAGCTLADIIGEWTAYVVPVHIGESLIAGRWVLDFILALLIGVYFQYSAIREMETISSGKAVGRAFKADFLSLTAWQVGMYGWMALVHFVFFKGVALDASSWLFWFMMQIAMLFGFLCAFPMNALLIKWGIKKGM